MRPDRPSPIEIERITLLRVLLPLRTPFRTARGSWTERDVLLVRVDGTSASSGAAVTGWGECVATTDPGYTSEYTAGCAAVLDTELLPLLRRHLDTHGQVASDELGDVWAPVRGHSMAKAAVEMALVDAECRAANVSLAEQLGATTDRVAVGVVVGRTDTIPALVTTVQQVVDAGYRRLKLKVTPAWSAEPVAAVRGAVGSGVDLMVDANGSFDPSLDDHWHLLRAMGDHGLVMIEQPFDVDHLAAHGDAVDQLATPICLDESVHSIAAGLDALALGAADVLAIKPGRLGGLWAGRTLADHVARQGAAAWHGGMLETGIGRAAALALAACDGFTLPADLSASDRYWERDLVTEPATLNADGTIDVPAGPGLGVTVDEDFVDAHRHLPDVIWGR